MWANSVWGFAGFAGAFGIAVLGLPSEFVWLRPWFAGAATLCVILSLAVLCWPLRKSENRRKTKGALKHPKEWFVANVEPKHLLVAGLIGVLVFTAIALAGAIWQSRRDDPRIASLQDKIASQQTEIKNLQDGLVAARERQATQAHPPKQPPPRPAMPAKTYYPREAENLVLALQRLRTVIRTDLHEAITRTDLPNFEQIIRQGQRMPGPPLASGQQPPESWRQERWKGILTAQVNTITKIQESINSGNTKIYQLIRSDEYAGQREIFDPFTQQVGISNNFLQASRDYISSLQTFEQNGWQPTWEIFRTHDAAFTTAFREYVNQLQTAMNAIDTQIKEIREHTR